MMNRIIISGFKLFAAIGMLFLAAVLPNHAHSNQPTKLPGQSRSLNWHPETGVIVASMALKGVGFFKVEGTKVVAESIHPDWATLDAIPLPNGRFLLAERFGSLRIVRPGKTQGESLFVEEVSYPLEGIPANVQLSRGNLYVSLGGAGLQIFDWSESDKAPVLRGRYPFVDYSREFVLTHDGHGALADNFETGVQFLNISDPIKPKHIQTEGRGFVDAVATHGNLLVVGSRKVGTYIFEIRPGQTPTLVERQFLPLGGPQKAPFPEVRRVRINPEGTRLLICEGVSGARLFALERQTEGVFPALKAVAVLPATNSRRGVSDGRFLSGGRLALSLEGGGLLIEPHR